MVISDRAKIKDLISKASGMLKSNPCIALHHHLPCDHVEFILSAAYPGSRLADQYPNVSPVYQNIHRHFISAFKLPNNATWTGTAIYIPVTCVLEAHRLKQRFFELGMVRYRTVHRSLNGCDPRLFLRIDSHSHFAEDPLMASRKNYSRLINKGLQPDFVVSTLHSKGNTIAEFPLTHENVLAVSSYIEMSDCQPKPYLAYNNMNALDAFSLVIPAIEALNYQSRGMSINTLRDMVSDYRIDTLAPDHFHTSLTGKNVFEKTLLKIKTEVPIY
jgi:hypothetical protein